MFSWRCFPLTLLGIFFFLMFPSLRVQLYLVPFFVCLWSAFSYSFWSFVTHNSSCQPFSFCVQEWIFAFLHNLLCVFMKDAIFVQLQIFPGVTSCFKPSQRSLDLCSGVNIQHHFTQHSFLPSSHPRMKEFRYISAVRYHTYSSSFSIHSCNEMWRCELFAPSG